MWTFAPHVAEHVFNAWVRKYKIPVHLEERLDRKTGITMTKSRPPRIMAITTESGRTFGGRMFIDATYEGDLMAAAGVTYTVGREPNSKYGETLNGVQKNRPIHGHLFLKPVDPYVVPGNPNSGLLPGIEPPPYPKDGQGDHRVQTYCYRMCMSNVAENRVPFLKPAGYDERQYELLLRNFEAGDLRLPLSLGILPNGKTDTNNNFAVSTDDIGQNYKYPEASYAERERILKAHRIYQQGLMWTLANHPRVPQVIRDRMKQWGLAKDEFLQTDHWPHQIYVREARRMVGEYVHTENDCRRKRVTPRPVGMGSYNMDSHNCMRYVTDKGYVQNEGDIQVSPGGPYPISYLSIIPKKGEVANLLVPVCVSSSHIAYGSIRMEPVFMILGQSAATAAVIAIDSRVAVQNVDYRALSQRLVKDKQVLVYTGRYYTPAVGIDPKKLPGIVIDDVSADRVGIWKTSRSVTGFVGTSYLHDGNAQKGKRHVRFGVNIKRSGRYEVRITYAANGNRATRVPVTIQTADGPVTVHVNQRKTPPIDKTWISLGTYNFKAGKATITISNQGTTGFVIADAVQLLLKDK